MSFLRIKIYYCIIIHQINVMWLRDINIIVQVMGHVCNHNNRMYLLINKIMIMYVLYHNI